MADPWSTSPTLPTATLPTPPLRSLPPTQHVQSASIDNGGNPLAQGLMAIPSWWEKEVRATVRLVPQKEGRWPGLKWTVYEVAVKGGGGQETSVHRRYSEFAWLWECLVKRVRHVSFSAACASESHQPRPLTLLAGILRPPQYPFRCIVGLPPKRLGADPSFLEQRRRALARFLQFTVNHPALKHDHLVQAFVTEPSLEVWRKGKVRGRDPGLVPAEAVRWLTAKPSTCRAPTSTLTRSARAASCPSARSSRSRPTCTRSLCASLVASCSNRLLSAALPAADPGSIPPLAGLSLQHRPAHPLAAHRVLDNPDADIRAARAPA